MEPITLAVIAFLSTGTFATIFTAVLKYKEKFRADESDADERLMTRQDKTILELSNEVKSQDRYITKLQNALLKAGAEVPERKDTHE